MDIFKPVPREIDFQATENAWARFWKEQKIFDKQLAQGRARAAAALCARPAVPG